MNTRTKLLTASGGVLLLAGVGGALALWSDAADGDALLASTGHLNLSVGANNAVWDVSETCYPHYETGYDDIAWLDCSDPSVTENPADSVETDQQNIYNGTKVNPPQLGLVPVDKDGKPVSGPDAVGFVGYVFSDDENGLDQFLMVPGDTIRVAAQFEVDLQGQNIAAQLQINTDMPTGVPEGQTWWTVDSKNVADTTFALLSDGLNQFAVSPVGVYQDTDVQSAFEDSADVELMGTPKSEVVFFVGTDVHQGAYAFFDVHFIDFNNPTDLSLYGISGTPRANVGENDYNGMTVTMTDDTTGTESDLMNLGQVQTITTGADPDADPPVAGTTTTITPGKLLNVIGGINALLIQVRPAAAS